MSDIVERLRELEAVESELACECDCPPEATANYRYAMTCAEAADLINTLRAEVERLRVENIQMQAALGYGILAEDERHILPSNPFKCGTCDASKRLRADNERLRQVLENTQQARVLQGKAITDASNEIERLKAALEEVMQWSKPHDRVNIIARAVLGEGK